MAQSSQTMRNMNLNATIPNQLEAWIRAVIPCITKYKPKYKPLALIPREWKYRFMWDFFNG